ncbi:hypothetical protein CASFOL_031579 [Castilleja foliolosa]|uniref:F-box domain-containing protein n=1 Tax=Castilleja foliolosa TaxID=1961234 RepID=A0ABD3C711_9LAMI
MADYMRKTEWLLEEILVRLTGVEIVRSKLVCKDWRDLINSPDFLSVHYNHHILCQEDEPIPGLLKKYNKRKSNWDYEDLDDNDMKDSSEEEELDEPAAAPKTEPMKNRLTKLHLINMAAKTEPMPTKKAYKKTAAIRRLQRK